MSYYKQNNNNRVRNNNTPNQEVKTPYAFVPLPKTFFTPDWADRISQDVPFSDGITGSISFEMVAQTPVFVRDGQEDTSSFCKSSDGRYFIPATSIKGEISSVLRIMSYGKVGQVRNGTFGKRNLNDSTYRDAMSNVHCGWMYFTEKGVEIEDCDIPARVSLQDIDDIFNTSYVEFVKNGDNFRSDYNRTAKKKYEMFPKDKSKVCLFREDDRPKNRVDNREIVKIIRTTQKDAFYGEIVFTGQPGVRRMTNNRWAGKFYEFVFVCFEEKIVKPVSDSVFQDFETIHSASPDYVEFRKQELYNGKHIPIFFLMDEKGDVISIGLSYLYKYPYKKSIYDAIPDNNQDVSKKDLCDCLFGYSTPQQSLKGRVHFGHAFAKDSPTPDKGKDFYMSQPRASFYPFYVKDGKSWDNAEQIAGWKRYPIRIQSRLLPSPQGTEAMKSKAEMLPAGTAFQETIRFHNLRPIELGALLSAITFHGNNDKCLHSIGLGKPLGYGAIMINNLLLETDSELKDSLAYMAVFEEQMTSIDGNWLDSPQLKELLLMAIGIPGNKAASFEYLNDPKAYYRLKANNQKLRSFSERVDGEQFKISSLKNKTK